MVGDDKLFLSEGIGIPLARRKVARCGANVADCLPAMFVFNSIVTRIADMLMHHTCRIEDRLAAYATVPVVLVPCQAC